MISFNCLGSMGRLGNQMFQYAALKGIATHKGYLYSVPANTSLDCCFNIPPTPLNKNTHTVSCENFHFDQDFFNECCDNVDITGYFQSEKYFQHIRDQIKLDFSFKPAIKESCLDYKKDIFKDNNVIAIHIRRMDYVTDNNYINLPISYYKDALNLLPKCPVLVFSDDIKWAKEEFTEDNIFFSPFVDSCLDMCLMSLCDYHVIANSSFSWWGAWLSESKQTIAPKKWFCGKYAHWKTKDLYLSNWLQL